MEKQIPFKFDIQFGETFIPTQEDPTLKKGKVRVFYKGLNRNCSYITDSFAQKLIESANLKPIVGTYLYSEKDFGGHEESTDKRAYGVVVPNSGTWEEHLDSDGVKRTYATFDVIVWAEYWDEAKEIFSKAQSMELDKNTIKGSWKDIIYNDFEDQAFVYTDGVIKGLCVLGKREPCFEGAAFFDLADDSYKQFTLAMQKYFNGGKDAMEEVKQETSVEVTEEVFTETEPTAETQVEAPAEAEASAPTESEKVKEEEETPATENTVEETSEEPATEPVAEETPNFEDKYNELLETYNALQTQYDALVEQHKTLQEDYNKTSEEKEVADQLYEAVKQDLASKEETISNYSKRIQKYEQEEKEELLKKFSKCLPAPVMQEVNDSMANMTLDELNTRLAMEYTSFSMAKEQDEEIRVPQVPKESNAFAQLLSKYKK